MKIKQLGAEMLGTFILVLLGCGSAILAGSQIGNVGVALSFGLTLTLLIYSIGPISGCHINPAVTLSMLLTRKITLGNAFWYIVAQLIGGVLAGYALHQIASGSPTFSLVQGFAINGFGHNSPHHFSATTCFVVEALMTAVLLMVVLATTRSSFPGTIAGVIIGFALIVIHLVSIPVTNTSVNFARSLATAVIAGPKAIDQLWLFALAQLAGVLIAVALHKSLSNNSR